MCVNLQPEKAEPLLPLPSVDAVFYIGTLLAGCHIFCPHFDPSFSIRTLENTKPPQEYFKKFLRGLQGEGKAEPRNCKGKAMA
jgi:hypothetical protein